MSIHFATNDFTKWFLEDSPELYEWFVKNGYEVFWDEITQSPYVRSKSGEFEEMSFDLFSAITIASMREGEK